MMNSMMRCVTATMLLVSIYSDAVVADAQVRRSTGWLSPRGRLYGSDPRVKDDDYSEANEKPHSRSLLPSTCPAPDTSALTWTYDTSSSIGPALWSTVDPDCGSASQTPIDLDSASATSGALVAIDTAFSADGECKEYFGETSDLTWEVADLHKCAHKLKLAYGGAGYVMKQFHYHSPSEHTVDGKHYDAEVHFVFVPEADTSKTGPVISVLVNGDTSATTAAETWLNQFVYDNQAHETERPIDPVADFFPKDKQYYSYTGSYTTPSCKDGVVPWLVLVNPVEVSYHWIAKYKAALTALPQTFLSLTNNRPVQPLGRRTVTKSPK